MVVTLRRRRQQWRRDLKISFHFSLDTQHEQVIHKECGYCSLVVVVSAVWLVQLRQRRGCNSLSRSFLTYTHSHAVLCCIYWLVLPFCRCMPVKCTLMDAGCSSQAPSCHFPLSLSSGRCFPSQKALLIGRVRGVAQTNTKKKRERTAGGLYWKSVQCSSQFSMVTHS